MKTNEKKPAWFELRSPALKIVMIMKLTACLILLATFGLMAGQSYAQKTKLSLSMKDASVERVLNAIEEQSEFYFLYSRKVVDIDRKVDIAASGKTVNEILDDLFSGVGVNYAVYGRQIVLSAPGEPLVQGLSAQQPPAVSGTVTDRAGSPLPGVTVVIKGTTVGTITDTDGKYSVSTIPANASLVFSFVGMRTQEVAVGSQTIINIALIEETIGIEEVVAVGYGTQKRVNLTGSVVQVGSEVLENRPVTSVSQALQGVMSGVTVQQTDGRPGGNASIRIRGFSSLNSGGALVIVDGVPGNLNSLNPNDIETITVLKDAASAAIYGARGAEGVILVTTKSGKEGKITVTYQGNFGFQKPTIFPKQSHSYDGAALANLAAQNAGASAFYSAALIEAMKDPSVTAIPRADGQEWDYVADFDWAGYFLKDFFTLNQNLTVNGGGAGNKYLLSIGWLDQNGYFSKWGPDNFDRYNLRLNMINDLIPEKLILDTRLSLAVTELEEASNGVGYIMQSVIQAGRSMPLYNPDGTYARFRMQQNSMQIMKESGFNKTLSNRFEGQSTLLWKATRDLELKAQGGYNINWGKGILFGRGYYKYRPIGATNFGWINQPNRVVLDNSYNRYYTAQILANYTKSIKNHNFKVLAGSSVEENFYEVNGATRFNILGNELPALNLGSTTGALNSYSGTEWGIISGFGRFNYDYAGKYLVEANFRADGSSRFSGKNRWGYFPSFSAGWRVSEENFMQSLTGLSNLKFRASYGEVGNQNGLGLYDHIPVYQITTGLIAFPAADEQQILNPRLPSQDRSWETVTTTNVGIDLGLFENRLSLEADYFLKRNKDMLISIEVPSVIGISVPTNNNGELETRGWETTIRWNDNISRIGFKYGIGLNLYDQTDKIVSLNQTFVNIAQGVQNLQGYPVNSIFAYEAAGYFQTAEEVSNWAFQHARTAPGDIKYIDQDDDKRISAPNDLIHAGTTTPRYLYGINLDAEWKNFDLSMLFQGVGERKFYLSGMVVQPYFNNFDNQSFAVHMDYWTPDNPKARFPRPVMGGSWNYLYSTHWLQDASYIRLKNLQLGYNVPVKPWGINNIRVYFSGENLWEKTNLIMFDPELNNSSAHVVYPLNRNYSFGLNITF
jgi:TonB-linked SusC/RagA family outer membrane protein